MNQVVKVIGVIVVTIAILGLPVLTCLSFIFKWDICCILTIVVAIEAVIIAFEVYERSEE